MERQYKSGMASTIRAFLEQKHSLGFKYVENQRYLYNFDDMCYKKFPHETTITREMGMEWAISLQGENKGGMARRMSPVRELARFMIRMGKKAFVIPEEFGKNPPYRNYEPHIFTHEELVALFHAADNLPYNVKYPFSALQPPVYLRLLYACGLRPHEGRLILRENIDLSNGTIFIPESKKSRDRIVVMDNIMLNICQKYDRRAKSIDKDSEYFFPTQKTNSTNYPHHDSHWGARVLNTCLVNANLTNFDGNKPRPYDLRHTFATHTLYRWLREGKNLDNCLPYLSAYMGHEHFQHTAYYIHLIPDFFPQIQLSSTKKFGFIIPEVK